MDAGGTCVWQWILMGLDCAVLGRLLGYRAELLVGSFSPEIDVLLIDVHNASKVSSSTRDVLDMCIVFVVLKSTSISLLNCSM